MCIIRNVSSSIYFTSVHPINRRMNSFLSYRPLYLHCCVRVIGSDGKIVHVWSGDNRPKGEVMNSRTYLDNLQVRGPLLPFICNPHCTYTHLFH